MSDIAARSRQYCTHTGAANKTTADLVRICSDVGEGPVSNPVGAVGWSSFVPGIESFRETDLNLGKPDAINAFLHCRNIRRPSSFRMQMSRNTSCCYQITRLVAKVCWIITILQLNCYPLKHTPLHCLYTVAYKISTIRNSECVNLSWRYTALSITSPTVLTLPFSFLET